MIKKICCFCLTGILLFLTGCNITPTVGIDSSELEPFVIGGMGPLTEDRGKYGTSVYQGAQLAVSEINATGGVNGFRLVLKFQDTKGDPEAAAGLYDKLRDNNMKVFLGGVFSDETEALIPTLTKDGILSLSPTASHASALGGEGTMFRVCFSDARLGTFAANFIYDNHLADRVTVLWSDDVYGGTEQVQAFVSAFTGRGGFADLYEISTEAPFDFTDVLSDLEKKSPEMIYLALSPQLAQAFLKEYEWDGSLSPVKILGTGGLEGLPESIKNLSSLNGMYVVTSFSSSDSSPLVQNFVSNYQETYGQLPDRYAADGYDSVYALAEAMKKAGITPENVDDGDFNRKMISAMTKITVNGVTGVMSWTADGETTRPAEVKTVREGAYVSFSSKDGA